VSLVSGVRAKLASPPCVCHATALLTRPNLDPAYGWLHNETA